MQVGLCAGVCARAVGNDAGSDDASAAVSSASDTVDAGKFISSLYRFHANAPSLQRNTSVRSPHIVVLCHEKG